MKKLFVSLLAVAALAACKKDTLIQTQEGTAIAFGQAFVDNVTRASEDPSTTTDKINQMHVWGFMDKPSGIVFFQQQVDKKENQWVYSPVQYWYPGHTYYFAAVSPFDNQKNVQVQHSFDDNTYKGLGKITFTNVDGSTDLLYSATTVSTMDMRIGQDMPKVAFTFNHLLSKVKFSFTNTFPDWFNEIRVTDIKMTVPKKGMIDVAQDDWWSTNQWVLDSKGENLVLSFGDMHLKDKESKAVGGGYSGESDKERLTIPTDATHSYTVSFTVSLYAGNVLALTRTLETEITGAALEIGKAYNFHANIGPSNISGEGALKPITFDVAEVKEWVDGNGYDGGVIDTTVATDND